MAFPVYAFPAKLKKPPKGVEEDKHSKGEDEEDDRVQMTFRSANLKSKNLEMTFVYLYGAESALSMLSYVCSVSFYYTP